MLRDMGKRNLPSFNNLHDAILTCSGIDSSAEKEEKAIAAIKKEPIQVDQFLQKLRQKKLDKYLNYEVRVSMLELYYFYTVNQNSYTCIFLTF